jgi:hypothetical protein
MLNNNFAAYVLYTTSATAMSTTDWNGTTANRSGTLGYLYGNFGKYNFDNLASGSTCFVFGTGENSASLTDHQLTSRVDGNGDFTQVSARKESQANTRKLIFTSVWEYTGSDPITIKEIGLVNNNSGNKIMVDRTVLESPITVDSEHTTFTISLTIGGRATAQLNS